MMRDQIILVDRITNKSVKTIKFDSKKFAPSDKEIEYEEGKPNFNIVTDGNVYFIVEMKNKVLEVYRTQ